MDMLSKSSVCQRVIAQQALFKEFKEGSKMNIGIILYSQSGNTLSVAQKLQEKLIALGHTVNIEQITVTGDVSPGKRQFELTAIPAVDPYEGLVFATPVQAFSLNPVMAAYLEQVPSLKEKKFACLITKHLPFSWTGGKQAIPGSRNRRLVRVSPPSQY
jgi:flavorubredoxin